MKKITEDKGRVRPVVEGDFQCDDIGNSTRFYEILSIVGYVKDDGTKIGYISKTDVPIGIPITDTEYWYPFQVIAVPKGDKGEDGKSAYDLYLENGGTITPVEAWLASLQGKDGKDGKDGQPLMLRVTPDGQSLEISDDGGHTWYMFEKNFNKLRVLGYLNSVSELPRNANIGDIYGVKLPNEEVEPGHSAYELWINTVIGWNEDYTITKIYDYDTELPSYATDGSTVVVPVKYLTLDKQKVDGYKVYRFDQAKNGWTMILNTAEIFASKEDIVNHGDNVYALVQGDSKKTYHDITNWINGSLDENNKYQEDLTSIIGTCPIDGSVRELSYNIASGYKADIRILSDDQPTPADIDNPTIVYDTEIVEGIGSITIPSSAKSIIVTMKSVNEEEEIPTSAGTMVSLYSVKEEKIILYKRNIGWVYFGTNASITYVLIQDVEEGSPINILSGEAVKTCYNILKSNIGYFVCNTNGNVALKQIDAPNYNLIIGGSIKVKMLNENISNDSVTLKIGNAEAKPLYYNGAPVSSQNTWSDEELVEIYYDGTNYNITNNLDKYIDYPGWIALLIDNDKKVLGGIREDGSFEWYVGVPTPIKKYVEQKVTVIGEAIATLADSINTELDKKVDKEDGKSLINKDYADGIDVIENDEFLEVKTDSDDKVVEGTKIDGTKVLYGGVVVKHKAKVDCEIDTKQYTTSTINNDEFIYLWTDLEGNILAGLKKDGNIYFGAGVPPQIKKYIKNSLQSLKEYIDTTLATLDNNIKETYGEYIDNDEYIDIKTDNNDRLLEGTLKSGKKVFFGGIKSKDADIDKLNIDGFVQESINTSDWLSLEIDVENRIISGTRKNGSKYFKELEVDNINIKSEPILIRVATFNTGDYTGTNLTSDEAISAYRKLIGELGANLIGTQEDIAQFNGADIRETFWKMFKSYQRRGTQNLNYKAFASDYKIDNVREIAYVGSYTYRHTYFLAGELNLHCKNILVLSFHFDWSDNDTRRDQIKQIIDYASAYDYVIMLGDTNCNNYVDGQLRTPPNLHDVEWPIFSLAGYRMANDGYFGLFNTCGYDYSDPSRREPIDNIFVKGNIVIRNADIIVKDWTNDHCILYADLAIY